MANLNLKTSICKSYIYDKEGLLANAYLPLQNLITDKKGLGDFTTKNLQFDRYTPVDIIVSDEYDGSENLILNDDKNKPKLVNTRLAILENNKYKIPEHNGNSVTNVYENAKLETLINLIKLYNTIPTIEFLGLSDGGKLSCGSYVFYFKLADADGNMTNVVLHSRLVQVFIGENGSSKIRMGMLDENSDKFVSFKLTNLDSGFDYVKVFYERVSSDNAQLLVDTYYMVNQNYPIKDKECYIDIFGSEDILQISKSDIQTQFADIQTAKTQVMNLNILFLGNVTAYKQEYKKLQELAWKIVPTQEVVENKVGLVNADYDTSTGNNVYYTTKNVYKYVGYWPDEYYRFGIVFIYDNNVLSPTFNIQGLDFLQYTDSSKTKKLSDLTYSELFESILCKDGTSSEDREYWDTDPEDHIFKKAYLTNSKGVIRFDNEQILRTNGLSLRPNVLKLNFNFAYINEQTGYDTPEEYLKSLHIKGFFFVRLKRLASILGLGLVIGLTGKDYGSIPVILKSNKYVTKSFLNSNRLLLETGADVEVKSEVTQQALLVPDAELLEFVYNSLLVGLEFALLKIGNISFINGDNLNRVILNSYSQSIGDYVTSKVTNIPAETTLKTDGETYFSTVAGNETEAYKTKDVNYVWDETAPQDLTVSTSLIRGKWGSYVGISSTDFEYGDIVNIKVKLFAVSESDLNLLEFLKRFTDYSFYSPISDRMNISDTISYDCFGGDCFPSLYTHRMMTNFVDPELPTNTKIIDPTTWAKNYAVRCTADPNATTHLNIATKLSGWYITGLLDKFANEVVTAFETYSANAGDIIYSGDNLKTLLDEGHIQTVEQSGQESIGTSLKKIFTNTTDWTLHGLGSINRADVNAVSFGLWITFPICSSMNLALRDIDFNQATEEAKFNKKRAFYPYEQINVYNHLPDSTLINGATKRTISSIQLPVYTLIPYVKQEYFNRIYWSKPNVAQSFINSYRFIFDTQYHEYNKEFGSITKLLSIGNHILVVFLHGMGTLEVNRLPQSELEKSPYLASLSVIPSNLTILSKDYGSMWKDSVIQTPLGIVYGVDTVAKKIWVTDGLKLTFISDHKFNKFLNKYLALSEFDLKEYQGHINVKSHYNEFKHDVMFTFFKDTLESDGSWTSGVTWNLCYNEQLQAFSTFYDWIPVESANIDNIWFTFDRDDIDRVYKNSSENIDKSSTIVTGYDCTYTVNRKSIDPSFTDIVPIYRCLTSTKVQNKKDWRLCFYANKLLTNLTDFTYYKVSDDWYFYFETNIATTTKAAIVLGQSGMELADPKYTKLTDTTTTGPLAYYNLRKSSDTCLDLWKHGQAGLYDNQGTLLPTTWYGKLHEFNFEFIVNDKPSILKIYNNLKIISNKAKPAKFEYEVIGEGYEWFEYKSIVEWINAQEQDTTDPYKWWKIVLGNNSNTLQLDYKSFPTFRDGTAIIQKLPYLKMELTDMKGTPARPNYSKDYWDLNVTPSSTKDCKYAYNSNETCLIADEQLNELKVHSELLGNDMKQYGRIRGNMEYLEDLWNVEIRPITFKWIYKTSPTTVAEKKVETRNRDKFIRIKIRYSGEDLAVIHSLATLYNISYA